MCLDVISPTKPKRNGKGYKVFYKPRKYCYSLFRGNMKPMKVNQWLNEKTFREYSTDENISVKYYSGKLYYPQGFHVFTNKKTAISYANQRPGWVFKRIQYKNATTKGKWGLDGTIVAEEIFIPKE